MGGLREEVAKLQRRVAAARRADAGGEDFSPLALAHKAGLDLLPWQRAALTSRASRQLYLCARQAGKSTVAGIWACHTALSRPGALVMLISMSLPHAQELYRKVRGVWEAAGCPYGAVSSTALTMELGNGSRVVSRPGGGDAGTGVRSYTADVAVVDEGAFVPDAVYHALTPTLARTGGKLLALSTPWGQAGWFHDEWFGGGDEWGRFKVTALDLPEEGWYKPSRDAFLKAELRRLGRRRFDQEYMCSFQGAEDSAFGIADVERAFAPTDWEPFLDNNRKVANF